MLFLGVIYIEHLVFYPLFQLINSTNKPIPVIHINIISRHVHKRACNMLNAALHAQPFFCWIGLKHEYKQE